MTREEINNEIDKYRLQAKKVRKVIPLVTVIAISTATFFLKDFDKYPSNSFKGLGSIAIFASSFAYTYFKSVSKVKELEKQLNQL